MDDKIITLSDALFWKKTQALSASEFVMALQLWQEIDEGQALQQLLELMVCGLPIHVRAHFVGTELNPGSQVPSGLAMAAVAAKRLDTPMHEIDGEPVPDFKDLTIIRDQAFSVFSTLGITPPYPWIYPDDWLEPDSETDQEDKEVAEEPLHGNAVRHAIKREEVLSACLAVLAQFPDECRNQAGQVKATKLRECLERQALKIWPSVGCPPLGSETIEKLIRNAIGKLKI